MAESLDTSEVLPDEDDRKLFVGGLPQVSGPPWRCQRGLVAYYRVTLVVLSFSVNRSESYQISEWL